MTNTTDPIKPKKPIYSRPKFIAWALASIVFLILIIQNSQSVSIDVFFWKATAPSALLYLIFALIGFIVGWLLKRSHAASKSAKD